MVEGDSIDGLEEIPQYAGNEDISKTHIVETQVAVLQPDKNEQKELRRQLESCLADNSILNEKLYEKEDNNDKLTGEKNVPKKKINDGFFKQFVRHFLEKMSCLDENCPEPSDIVYIYLTLYDIETLNKYVSGKGDVSDALYVMKNMVQGVQLTEYTSYWDRLLSLTGMDQMMSKAIIAVTVLLIGCVAFEMKTSMTWWNQLLIVFVILFVISIPWNWLQLYQEKLAERHAEMIKETDIPEFCRPGAELTPWKVLQQFFKKYTSIKDDCKEYHKRYMVDPILEVSPIKAVAKTIAVLLFAPAGELGKAVAEFHNEFLGNMPTLIWIPAFVSWLLMLAVILLVLYYGCSSGHANIHHVSPAIPQAVVHQPSRQMIEDIVQEQMKRESFIGYQHAQQEFRSPSLPPVTLRARGHSNLQELEAENQRAVRRSPDYIDGRGKTSSTAEKSPASHVQTQNVEITEQNTSEIVKEVLAQILIQNNPHQQMAEKNYDQFSSSPKDINVSNNKNIPVQETMNLMKEDFGKCVPHTCVQDKEILSKTIADEVNESSLDKRFDVKQDGQRVETQLDDKNISRDSVENISSSVFEDLPSNTKDDDNALDDNKDNDTNNDDNDSDEDDFVVLQTSN